MNRAEAFKILEISETSNSSEVKKAFRKMAGKYHPDINKEPGAETTFKKINEAYNVIEKGEDFGPQNKPPTHQNINIEDIFGFGGNHQRRSYNNSNINLNANISFKESIFGCNKDFNYNRSVKCQNCDGQGIFNIHNGCTECNGNGRVMRQQGNMVMAMSCPSCNGKTSKENCKPCNGSGEINTNTNVSVKIPGGAYTGAILRLEGMGNFAGSINNMFQRGDFYTDVFIKINVENKHGFKLVDNDVETDITISLLEALTGTKRKIETLDGFEDLNINSKTKNGDVLIIPNMGVNREGNQVIKINVEYPDDVNYLIQHLEKNSNKNENINELLKI